MHNKIGFIVNNLGGNQQAFYLINYINSAIVKNRDDITIFYEIPVIPCIGTNFGIMQLNEAYGYDGVLIANNLMLADKMAYFPGTKEKYFYVWDLEWLRIANKNFHILHPMYNNPLYKLIARSHEHSKIISDCWNTEVVGVVDDFNINQFIEIINEQRAKQRISST
jgi:hypothetical protein